MSVHKESSVNNGSLRTPYLIAWKYLNLGKHSIDNNHERGKVFFITSNNVLTLLKFVCGFLVFVQLHMYFSI